MKLLSGRHAFVTGSSQGIGLAIAVALRDAGANVVLHGIVLHDAAREGSERCSSPDGPAPVIVGDLVDPMPEAPLRMAREALERDPAIDTLVCNAGDVY